MRSRCLSCDAKSVRREGELLAVFLVELVEFVYGSSQIREFTTPSYGSYSADEILIP